MTARTWTMFCNDYGPGSRVRFRHFGERWWAELADAEMPVVEVLITEDVDGGYTGWLETGSTTIDLVCLAFFFSGQFTYGAAAEVARGRGVTVPVRIELSTSEAPCA